MIFVVFASRAAFDAFKLAFPSTLVDPDTLLGEPAYESVDEDGAPVEGSRVYCAHHYNAAEAAMLQLAGATLHVGAVDGPVFGEEVEP